MTEQDRKQWLRRELARIQQELKTRPTDGAFRDQELSKAYKESGLTQEEIAKIHGCSESLVAKRLVFAAFLEWQSTRGTPVPLKRLIEKQFRTLFETTVTIKGQEPRFKVVMESLLSTWKVRDVAALIVESVRVGRNGQWFTAEEIADEHKIPVAMARLALKSMASRTESIGDGRGGIVMMEERQLGLNRQYRILEVAERPKVSSADFARLVSDLEETMKRVYLVIDGKTWVSTSPEVITMELHKVKKRLREARALIKEKPRSVAKDVPSPVSRDSVS